MSHDRPADGIRLTERARTRLSRLSIFSERDYLASNPDVAQAGIDGLRHALEHGVNEGRPVFSDAAVARAYGRVARGDEAPATAPPCAGRLRPSRSKPRCSVFVHSLSDAAYHASAAALAADLDGCGFAAVVRDERDDHLADHGVIVFVAPHEFFRLGRGPLWADPAILGQGYVLVDDPIDTVEGGQSLATLLEARGVVETSAVGAAIWSEATIPTLRIAPRVRLRHRWLEPDDLAHPLMLAAPPQARTLACDPLAWEGRSLDVLFFGRESPRRNAFFGRHAASLAAHRCYLYMQQGVAGKGEERLHRRAHGRIAGHLGTQARLTLNVSEGRFPSFDRRRMLDRAMAGGSVVVSDARFVEPGLRAGRHYFQDESNHLGGLIDWLINDADGRSAAERVRDEAFAHVAALNRDPDRLTGLRAFLLAGAADDGMEA